MLLGCVHHRVVYFLIAAQIVRRLYTSLQGVLSQCSADILGVALRLYKHIITVAMQLMLLNTIEMCGDWLRGRGGKQEGALSHQSAEMVGVTKMAQIMGLFTVAMQLVLLSITDLCSSCWQAVLSDHSAEVVGVALHPTNKYFITASADKSWAFYDLESTLCMAQVCLGFKALNGLGFKLRSSLGFQF